MRISICWTCAIGFVVAAAIAGNYFGRMADFVLVALAVQVAAVVLGLAQLQQRTPPERHSPAYGLFFQAIWTLVGVSALKNLNAGLGLAIFALWLSPIGRSPDR